MLTADTAYDQIRSTRGPSKYCSACATDHPIEQFAFKSLANGKLHSRCRAAQRTYSAQWYEQNSETHRARVGAARTDRVASLHARIDTWLTGRSCPCGSSGRLVAVGSTGCSLKTLVKRGYNDKDICVELEMAVVRCRDCSIGRGTQ